MELTIDKNKEVSIEKIESKEEFNIKNEKNSKAGFYDKHLDTLTNFFGFARVFTYIPTILILYTMANSNQYSLLTWCLWIFANAFTAAKVFKLNGFKYDSLVIANMANTLMCLVTVAFIVYYQLF